MIADQDAPHRLAFSGMYEFPFGKGRQFLSKPNWLTNAVVGGWQVGATVQLQSGFPIAFGQYNITTAVTSGDIFYKEATFNSFQPTKYQQVVQHLRVHFGVG